MINNKTVKLMALLTLVLSTFPVNSAVACEGDFKLVGSSNFSVWFWDVYDIELKTPDGKYSLGTYPLELELTYQRDIDKEDLISETKNQWERYKLEKKIEQSWLAQLSEIWPDVSENDRIRFRVCEDFKTQFFFNDAPIGDIVDRDFASYFSLIWLDPKGPYPKQVNRLTGQ